MVVSTATASALGCGARGLLPVVIVVVDGRVQAEASPTREGAYILTIRRLDSLSDRRDLTHLVTNLVTQ